MDLLEQGQWEAAAERFFYAAEARRTAGLVYHAAFCLEKLQRFHQALGLYQEAQALAEHDGAADVQALLPVALQRTDAALPQLTLQGLPEGAVVEVNGHTQTKLPVMRLDPSSYHIVVTAPGRDAFASQVDLAVGARIDLEVRMPPHAVQLADPAHEQGAKMAKRTPRAKPYVVAAAAVLGAAGLGVGIYGTVQYARLGKRQKELDEFIDDASDGSSSSCLDPGVGWADACDELRDVTRDRNTGKTWMIVGYTTLGVGALTALATQIFWQSPAVEVAWLPGGGFLSVTRQF
jgi:hypothetical protein